MSMIRRLMFATVAITLCALPAAAQNWETAADLGLALTQSGYSSNWAGDENGSITWTFTGNMSAAKQLNPKINWQNTLKLLYGETHQQAVDEAGERSWSSPEKSTDRIFLESLLKFTLGKWVDPYVALTVESQFYSAFAAPDGLTGDSFEAEKRSFLSPLLVSESAGVGRSLIEEEQRKLFTRVGFAFRQHRTHEPAPNDALTNWDLESSSVSDGGVEWVTDYEHTFAEERAKLVSKLRLFKALTNSESEALDAVDVDWGAVDIAFENTLSASISEYIQMTFFLELLMDKEIDEDMRFRETLGLGVSYKLF